MKGNRIMMTCSNEGISRAVEKTIEKWDVENVLTEPRVTCLATDPMNSNIVYAGTRESGVWRSEDQGKTWKQHGLQDRQIKSLAVNPHDPEIIYAGTKPALMFLSSGGGIPGKNLMVSERYATAGGGGPLPIHRAGKLK